MSYRDELAADVAETEAKFKAAKERLDRYDSDPWPVGTILQVQGAYGVFEPFLIKQARVHSSAGAVRQSSGPTWVSIFDDFSGQSYDTLEKARRGFGHRQFKVIHDPDGIRTGQVA